MTSAFDGVVLTGGASRRFGTDKAMVDVAGRALAAIVASALRDGGAATVTAVGGDLEGLVALGCFDRVVADLWPGEGPLGGILTAMDATAAPIVVVLACDTPGITAECPRSLVGAMVRSEPPADVAVGVVDGRQQPLTAAWRRAGATPAVRRAFESGERAPRRVLPDLRVVAVELAEDEVADVDRPLDLARYHSSLVDRTADPRDDRNQR